MKKPITFTAEEALLLRIREFAKKEKRSVSQALCILLEMALDELEARKK